MKRLALVLCAATAYAAPASEADQVAPIDGEGSAAAGSAAEWRRGAIDGEGSAAAEWRRGVIDRALAAVQALGATGRAALQARLTTAARERCHADAAPPAVACLIDAARAQCAGDAGCAAAADVAITNLRGEGDFVSTADRARLLRGSADYRAALDAELHRRYAVLAAELVLAGPRASEGAAIDELCRERDRALHACAPGDAACVPSLPWSRCVAALVWYVGGAP
ncbi:MAG TPA: hypothetical protein VLX92_21355 [Kofleriaceae bacterium]|nr:hypothetical protein [Kofleriaceae bacterium]